MGIFNNNNSSQQTTKKPSSVKIKQQQPVSVLLSQPSLNPMGICQIYTGSTCENYLKNQVSIQ